jgi:hypothetical protein
MYRYLLFPHRHNRNETRSKLLTSKYTHQFLNPINTCLNYQLEIKTNLFNKIYVHEKTRSSRTLFQEGQPANAPHNISSMHNSNLRTSPSHKDTTMTKATTNKRQYGEESAETSKRRASMDSKEQRKTNPYHKLNFWFGFLVME